MNWNGLKDAADFLNIELKKRVSNNPRYSLRMFARTLKLSPGELSEVLARKRPLSLKSAHKISQALALSPLDTDRFFRLILEAPKKQNQTHQVSEDMFHVIADWYCLALLSLTETKNFKFDIGHIAKRLGISLIEAKFALEHLEKVGLISKKNGRYAVVSDAVLSPDEISNEALKKAHLQILDKAKDALAIQKVEEREYSGVTFAVHPKHLPELKNELKLFMDKWMEKVGGNGERGSEPTEVYHLETVLFRLTEPQKEGKS